MIKTIARNSALLFVALVGFALCMLMIVPG